MIKVTIGTNVTRKTVIVPATTTLRTVLTDNEIDYARGTVNLDGCSLQPGDLDKTFADLGVTETCFLLRVDKADNA